MIHKLHNESCTPSEFREICINEYIKTIDVSSTAYLIAVKIMYTCVYNS